VTFCMNLRAAPAGLCASQWRPACCGCLLARLPGTGVGQQDRAHSKMPCSDGCIAAMHGRPAGLTRYAMPSSASNVPELAAEPGWHGFCTDINSCRHQRSAARQQFCILCCARALLLAVYTSDEHAQGSLAEALLADAKDATTSKWTSCTRSPDRLECQAGRLQEAPAHQPCWPVPRVE